MILTGAKTQAGCGATELANAEKSLLKPPATKRPSLRMSLMTNATLSSSSAANMESCSKSGRGTKSSATTTGASEIADAEEEAELEEEKAAEIAAELPGRIASR